MYVDGSEIIDGATLDERYLPNAKSDCTDAIGHRVSTVGGQFATNLRVNNFSLRVTFFVKHDRIVKTKLFYSLILRVDIYDLANRYRVLGSTPRQPVAVGYSKFRPLSLSPVSIVHSVVVRVVRIAFLLRLFFVGCNLYIIRRYEIWYDHIGQMGTEILFICCTIFSNTIHLRT